MQVKICGTVILYNPEENVYDNILSYYHQVGLLIAVDNSDIANIELINRIKLFKNISYISNHENLGVACALNIAANFAINRGFHYMLTMDQDTSIPEGTIERLMASLDDFSKIGIISPRHENTALTKPVKDLNHHESLVVMMCGNIINLNIFNKVGGFEEKLFIDYVDNDFCLKLNLNGFIVIQDNSISLLHKLGNRRVKHLLSMRFSPSNHSPVRLYYRTRNRFYVYMKYWKKFPVYVVKDFFHIFKELLSLLFFEEDKVTKVKNMYQGFRDFKNNSYGKKSNNTY